jgi:hypothetical protein
MGIQLSTLLGTDRRSMRNLRKDIISRGRKSHLVTMAKHPSDTMVEVITASDAGPRLAEFVGVLESHGYTVDGKRLIGPTGHHTPSPPRHVLVEAAMAANDVTTNFKRQGFKGREVNKYWTFFNAAIQGQDKQIRTLRDVALAGKTPEGSDDRHLRKQFLIAASMLSAATALYWLMRSDDDDYLEMEPWLREGYWTFSHRGNTIARIPKGYDWAMIPNSVEAILNQLSGRDKEAVKHALHQDMLRRVPGSGFAGAKPILEVGMDYDFFRNKRIEGPRLQERSSPYRSQPFTSDTARAVGWYTGHLGLGPAQLEHVVNSVTGGAYRRWINPIERVVNGEGLRAEDIPFLGGYHVKKHYPKSTGDFYDAYNQLGTERADAKHKNMNPGVELEGVWDEVSRYHGVIRDLWKVIDGVENPQERFDRAEKYIVGLSREALDRKPLATYPSLWTASLTPELKAVRDKHLGTLAIRAAANETPRRKDESAMDHAMRSHDTRLDAAAAREFLIRTRVPYQEILPILRAKAVKMRRKPEPYVERFMDRWIMPR